MWISVCRKTTLDPSVILHRNLLKNVLKIYYRTCNFETSRGSIDTTHTYKYHYIDLSGYSYIFRNTYVFINVYVSTMKEIESMNLR